MSNTIPEVTREQEVMALQPSDGELLRYDRAADGGQLRVVLRGCRVEMEHRPYVDDPDFPWGGWMLRAYRSVRPEALAYAAELVADEVAP